MFDCTVGDLVVGLKVGFQLGSIDGSAVGLALGGELGQLLVIGRSFLAAALDVCDMRRRTQRIKLIPTFCKF